MNQAPVQTRDIVVIGASAGGLAPLQRILGRLPENLPAAVFIVMHVGTSSRLASVLSRDATLPVTEAGSGDEIEHGRVLIAPPGFHLLLHDRHTLLRRGPRENMARPAIDPLFRSAACSFSTRVIGVILSGALNDGAAGLKAIKRCGGTAVVQDPQEADHPEMPRSALNHTQADHVIGADAIAGLLARLTAQRAPPAPEIPVEIRVETALAAQELQAMKTEDELGVRSPFTCPECAGTLWEIDDGELLRYRCHVGHAFTGQVLAAAQSQTFESMLWSLFRHSKERAALSRLLAERQNRFGDNLASEFERRAADYEEGAEIFRKLLLDRKSFEQERRLEERVDGQGGAQKAE